MNGSTRDMGVSFVVPLRNGASLICGTLESIVSEAEGQPFEIVVVDDGSTDGSLDVVKEFASTHAIRLLRRGGQGAAAALNAGIRAARFPIICQVDQDVRLLPDWMRMLTAELDNPDVAAAQGYYMTDARASLCARVMGLDLEQRYSAIGADTDHVCTGNAIYRAEALHRVGLFDETLGYGYDNDMSYRLLAAGYRLRFCRAARSIHAWRDGLTGYLRQQYGFGYGRIDLVAKHPERFAGDRVSPRAMMIHAPAMLVAIAALVGWGLSVVVEYPLPMLGALALALVGALALERLTAGYRSVRRFGNPAAWLFPVIHLLRDLAWVMAIGAWLFARLVRRTPMPSASMRPRNVNPLAVSRRAVRTPQVIGLIPAHNEAANLAAVVRDISSRRPDLAILVVNDGSTDETAAVLEELNVRSIHFAERMGIGSAMRAGLRYTLRLGFDVAVRLDGDGQHGAADIDTLLAPICAGEADVVLGTRYASANGGGRAAIRLLRLPLATCLTALTGRRVTDPTSGFCAFGPRAVRLLAEHHPNGYAEPELRLFLSRNGLRVREVPVCTHARLSGTTSLTPVRLTLAAARLALAILIVPLRATVTEPAHD